MELQQAKILEQESIIIDLLSFIKWEEAAHDQLSVLLKNQGISEMELTKESINEQLRKDALGARLYYMKLTQNEEDALDLTKPFRLYNNSIRLSTFEKINLLERETVKLLCKRIKISQEEIEFYEAKQEGHNQY